jgi:hypothetical protein
VHDLAGSKRSPWHSLLPALRLQVVPRVHEALLQGATVMRSGDAESAMNAPARTGPGWAQPCPGETWHPAEQTLRGGRGGLPEAV